MAKPKGAPKSGGRSKGTPNKATQDLMAKAQKLDVDPFEILLMYVKRDWEGLGHTGPTETRVLKDGGTIEIDRITPEMQIKAATEVCQYLYAKRKAVEISNESESEGFKVIITDYKKDK